MNSLPATSRPCPSQDLLRRVNIDTWTGLIAGDACKDYSKDEMVMNVTDKWAKKWLRSGDGKDWLEAHDLPRNPFFAPDRECSADDPHPVLEFQNPQNGSTITDTTLPISGVIDAKNGGFTSWRLEYGDGNDPDNWTVLAESNNSIGQPGVIYTWDLKDVTSNQVTLRLYLMNGEEYHAEKRITITLNLPTPTPTPTSTPPPTEVVPPTAIPTDTSVPAVVTPTNTMEPPTVAPPTETPTNTPEQ